MTMPEPGLSDPNEAEGRRIERARAGERAAQEELLRAHYARVHATAFRLLGNPEDAEDLAQECFVRAFRSLAYYRAQGSFAGWLRRILVHLAQDRYRARRRPEPVLLPPELSGGREPHRVLEGRELARILAEALAALAAPLRIALVLRTREGLEYEEIAVATGVTPATARTRVMKARKLLQRLLGPYLATHEADVRAAQRTPRRAP
jgi:RNA polymerase sigma-70 factor (ECF subfamily)